MNYEVVRGKLTNRGHILPKSQIKIEPCNEELYLSLFGFDNSIVEFVQLNKTVSGFNGSYFADFLYFDIDNADLNESLASARDLVTRLYNRFQLSPKQLYICFSGNKGFHIGLHGSLFGLFAPAPNLPQQMQVLAARLLAECYDLDLATLQVQAAALKKEGKQFADIDLGIYNPNRIFRATNSLNAKSGRYKVGITSLELLELPLESIIALAVAPRTDYRPETRLTGQMQIAALANLWEYAKTFDVAAFVKATGSKAGTGSIDREFFAPPMEGERDNTLFKQACHLFDHSELYETHVLSLIASINQASGNPLPDADLRRIVRSAFKRTQNKPKSVLTPDAKPAKTVEIYSDWAEEWLDYYTQPSSPMSCLLDEINADQENSFKGKVAAFIGSGGTRKSYGAQNVVVQNVLGLGHRGIYSSMEMGKAEVVNRLLDMQFQAEDGVCASRIMQGYARKDKEGTREILRIQAQTLNENLILSNNSNKTCADYETLIQETTALYGPVDFLAIDGLSAMGGKGRDETERYSQNTLDLKELAKQYNIFIILICHTTKASAAYTRDSTPFVRGSEKILDNTDFSICFSKVIDEARSTPTNIQYVPFLGHIKYYNKRGSGVMLNRLMEFDGLRKLFKPSDTPLINFPDYDSFVREYNRKARKGENKDVETSRFT